MMHLWEFLWTEWAWQESNLHLSLIGEALTGFGCPNFELHALGATGWI